MLAQLEQECTRNGKGELFAALKPFLLGEHGGATHATAAADLAMTVSAVKMAAARLRRRYRELLREAIAQTVSTPQDVDDEIRRLFAALAH